MPSMRSQMPVMSGTTVLSGSFEPGTCDMAAGPVASNVAVRTAHRMIRPPLPLVMDNPRNSTGLYSVSRILRVKGYHDEIDAGRCCPAGHCHCCHRAATGFLVRSRPRPPGLPGPGTRGRYGAVQDTTPLASGPSRCGDCRDYGSTTGPGPAEARCHFRRDRGRPVLEGGLVVGGQQ